MTPDCGKDCMFDDTDLPPLLQNAPDSTEFRKRRKRIIRETRAAIDQYGMIEPGARWLVCLSGGKDSYTLLAALVELQYCCRSSCWPATWTRASRGSPRPCCRT